MFYSVVTAVFFFNHDSFLALKQMHLEQRSDISIVNKPVGHASRAEFVHRPLDRPRRYYKAEIKYFDEKINEIKKKMKHL